MHNRSLHKDIFATQSLHRPGRHGLAVPQKMYGREEGFAAASRAVLPPLKTQRSISVVEDGPRDVHLRDLAVTGSNKLEAEAACVTVGTSLLCLNQSSANGNSVLIEQ